MTLWEKLKCTSDLLGLKISTCRLMTNLVLDVLQRRPSNDENVEKIRELVLTDRRQTIDQLSEISGLYSSSVQRILTEDLGIKSIAAKFIPRALTQSKRMPNFMSKVITGDESWCYGYDPETKQHSSQWKRPFFRQFIGVTCYSVPGMYRKLIFYPIYEFKNERGGTASSASPDEPPLVLEALNTLKKSIPPLYRDEQLPFSEP
ncbi:hypothetical protein NQ318_017189 [Aromia moschata]|uniref:Transposase n=1 Tax=Aromia moschata TaxID=1265417 RepID=A0AAV8YNS2_9CUCU|nr:hypothetical protein NQ318_017189 [Aromia moschata]